MYCTKCGAQLVETQRADGLSNYGDVYYNAQTGEPIQEISVYLVCPNSHWWTGGHDSLFARIEKIKP